MCARTFCQLSHQAAQMIGLFQLPFAYLNKILEILSDELEKPCPDNGLTHEEPVKRVLAVRRLSWKFRD